MKPAIALVIMLLIASTFSATTQDRDTSINGLGFPNAPCDLWTTNKRIPLNSSQPSLYGTFKTWMLGFVDGATYKDSRLGEIDPTEAVKLMDEYCAEHPSVRVKVAAGAVVEKFVKR
jgi:hypothetical protein